MSFIRKQSKTKDDFLKEILTAKLDLEHIGKRAAALQASLSQQSEDSPAVSKEFNKKSISWMILKLKEQSLTKKKLAADNALTLAFLCFRGWEFKPRKDKKHLKKTPVIELNGFEFDYDISIEKDIMQGVQLLKLSSDLRKKTASLTIARLCMGQCDHPDLIGANLSQPDKELSDRFLQLAVEQGSKTATELVKQGGLKQPRLPPISL